MKRTPGAVEPADLSVEAVYGPEGLRAVLEQSDYLVLCVPHTADTVGLIGAPELACLRRGAVLINIARGTIVDEEALIGALRGGQLGGAALDVVTHEPLAQDSPLWDMPNVLVTPHSMSTSLTENARLTDLFSENLRRYLDNQPLRNEIDKRRGY
jgi:phosphoglycerate dehydrogenase-like enzyme